MRAPSPARPKGVQLPSGQYFVNMLLANVSKHNVTRYIYEIDRLAQDIAGGFIATLPSQADLESPEVGKYVEKILQRRRWRIDGRPHAGSPSDRSHDRRHGTGRKACTVQAARRPRKLCIPNWQIWKRRRKQLSRLPA